MWCGRHREVLARPRRSGAKEAAGPHSWPTNGRYMPFKHEQAPTTDMTIVAHTATSGCMLPLANSPGSAVALSAWLHAARRPKVPGPGLIGELEALAP
jgi:hypothetical protein